MRFDIITLFPERINGYFQTGLLSKAIAKKIIELKLWDLKDFGLGRWKKVDDTPYGGGAGMVLRVDILDKAIQSARKGSKTKPHVILLTPQGDRLNQAKLIELAGRKRLVMISGYYEGFDERVRELVDEEISLGNFVLMSGDPAAIALVEGVSRLLPNVIGNPASTVLESHSIESELEYAQYTKPDNWKGNKVPKILLSGNHAEIAKWRKLAK